MLSVTPVGWISGSPFVDDPVPRRACIRTENQRFGARRSNDVTPLRAIGDSGRLIQSMRYGASFSIRMDSTIAPHAANDPHRLAGCRARKRTLCIKPAVNERSNSVSTTR